MGILSKIFGINKKVETETNNKFLTQTNSLETPKLKADFDQICKETIIPFFKQLGFKRKSLHFARQTNNVTQCFNVQKSKWNSYNDSVTFTFNFGFYNPEISAIISDKETQLDFPKTYDCFIQNRLGMFSHNRDHWYTLSQNIEATKTTEQIKTDLEKYLKPMFENYTSLDTLKLFLEKDEKYISPTLSPHYLIAFYMLTDQVEKGRQTIRELHRNALIPQTVTDTIIFPDGTRKETVRTQINQHFIDGMTKLANKYEVEL